MTEDTKVKITELPTLTEIDSEDLILVVDTSANATKNISLSNFTKHTDIIKKQSFSRQVSLDAYVDDYWDLGNYSVPDGYTFIGILPMQIGDRMKWQTTFGVEGTKVTAYTKSWSSQNATATISCNAIFLKN